MLLYSVKNRMIINNMNSVYLPQQFLLSLHSVHLMTTYWHILYCYLLLLPNIPKKKYQKVINKIIYKFCKYFEKTL